MKEAKIICVLAMVNHASTHYDIITAFHYNKWYKKQISLYLDLKTIL